MPHSPANPLPRRDRDCGLKAAAAALRATVARIRAERLREKAAREAERSRRREAADRLLAAALLGDPLAN